ncbi:MAG TPA: hypothetical protein VG943_10450 [Caulobacterales bacterium]|nr:hypothetical protein [Caulobacterales bacterium]
MSRSVIAVVSLAALSACATTSAPVTSWGKAGVSMVDYRIDAGQCAVVAATANPNENAARTAGGISQQNGQPVMSQAATGGGPGTVTGGASGAAVPLGGSVYRDSASSDFVQRAALQQRTQEIEMQRARVQAQRDCLTQRGYREFRLTEEQRAHLATLPEGSDERRNYLYSLGSDANVLNAQGM